MIIFDKIKKLLFTEEEIEEYVEEVEEVQKKPQKPVAQTPLRSQNKPERFRYLKEEEKKEWVVERKVPPKQAVVSTIDIKVDMPVTEKKIEKRLQPIERKDFEIPQVISPISGLKEDEIKNEKGNKVTQTTRPKKVKDPFSTVISPYYGVDELEEQATRAQTELAGSRLKRVQNTTIPTFDIDMEEEEMENISLDQIVSTQEEEEDEMIQFSLFGDNAPLKKIKESEPLEASFDEDETEDLPF